jgi:hypothetical protein
MTQPTGARGGDSRRLGWFGAISTTLTLCAVLASAMLFLSWPAFAETPGQPEDAIFGQFSMVEPPRAASGAARSVEAVGQSRSGSGDPAILLQNWDYTDGPDPRPHPSPGH